MPRAKLDDERIPQILDAFQRCVVKYGLAGSSLERVAREAGIARTLIHHYIGGRNDVLEMWLEQVTKKYEITMQQPTVNSLDALFEQFHAEIQDTEPDERIIQNELEAAATRDPEIREILSRRVQYFMELLANQLGTFYPQASPAQCTQAAYLLISLYQGHAVLRNTTVETPDKGTLRRVVQAIIGQCLTTSADRSIEPDAHS